MGVQTYPLIGLYIKKIYSSRSLNDDLVVKDFLDSCDLPTLVQEDRNALNAELTVSEILDTIKTMKCGKAPGPDGYSSEFYKEFGDLLSPHLFKLYTQAYNVGRLLPTLNEAIITVLPKKGKDPVEVSSYRPISLLPCDQKILAKALFIRLSSVMDKLIHPDQTGFIPNRHSSSNLRRLFNIIYSKPWASEFK